jgi:adenine-specific DNA-methyltransferase
MSNHTALELERQSEQLRIDGLSTAGERNAAGQFATSLPLALEIARLARALRKGSRDPIRFLEPALGTGAFYSALQQTFPSDLVTKAVGIERDPRFAATAQRLWHGTGLEVRQADFTALDPTTGQESFNLILTNPPYVRHHHLDRGEKLRLKRAVSQSQGILVSGLMGLYGYFLLLAHLWLSDGGVAAWLIPSEFMEVNYGAALRSYLTDRVRLLCIHRFSPADAQFDDAMVTSSVVVFEKAHAADDHVVSFSTGGSLLEPRVTRSVSVCELRQIPKWATAGILKESRSRRRPRLATLGDFFSIKRGIATGANAFFIMERRQARSLRIPDSFLRPILPGSRHLRQNIVECAPDGYPVLDRPLVVIDCPLPEPEVRERYPAFWTYLLDGKARHINEGYLASRRTPWYAQESRTPAPFLCTYMGRQSATGVPFRFFWNRSQAIARNVFLMLYPRAELSHALEARPDLHAVILEDLGRITIEALIDQGRAYGGGLHKLEPRELSSLPAPEWNSAIGG